MSVTWNQCEQVLNRLGLVFPTVAEWNSVTDDKGDSALAAVSDGVREWCVDWYDDTADGGEKRGKALVGGDSRVSFAAKEYSADNLGLRPARRLDSGAP